MFFGIEYNVLSLTRDTLSKTIVVLRKLTLLSSFPLLAKYVTNHYLNGRSLGKFINFVFLSYMPSETLRLLGNKINHLQPTVLPKRSVIVNERQEMSTLYAFFT